jgi:hypothetical protein
MSKIVLLWGFLLPNLNLSMEECKTGEITKAFSQQPDICTLDLLENPLYESMDKIMEDNLEKYFVNENREIKSNIKQNFRNYHISLNDISDFCDFALSELKKKIKTAIIKIVQNELNTKFYQGTDPVQHLTDTFVGINTRILDFSLKVQNNKSHFEIIKNQSFDSSLFSMAADNLEKELSMYIKTINTRYQFLLFSPNEKIKEKYSDIKKSKNISILLFFISTNYIFQCDNRIKNSFLDFFFYRILINNRTFGKFMNLKENKSLEHAPEYINNKIKLDESTRSWNYLSTIIPDLEQQKSKLELELKNLEESLIIAQEKYKHYNKAKRNEEKKLHEEIKKARGVILESNKDKRSQDNKEAIEKKKEALTEEFNENKKQIYIQLNDLKLIYQDLAVTFLKNEEIESTLKNFINNITWSFSPELQAGHNIVEPSLEEMIGFPNFFEKNFENTIKSRHFRDLSLIPNDENFDKKFYDSTKLNYISRYLYIYRNFMIKDQPLSKLEKNKNIPQNEEIIQEKEIFNHKGEILQTLIEENEMILESKEKLLNRLRLGELQIIKEVEQAKENLANNQEFINTNINIVNKSIKNEKDSLNDHNEVIKKSKELIEIEEQENLLILKDSQEEIRIILKEKVDEFYEEFLSNLI